jgi:hypothetical protein
MPEFYPISVDEKGVKVVGYPQNDQKPVFLPPDSVLVTELQLDELLDAFNEGGMDGVVKLLESWR